MKTAILSLVTAAALAASAGTADAQWRYSGSYRPVYTYSSYNASPYYGSFYSPSYVYPAGGFLFNTGSFGLSIGPTGRVYPHWSYGSPYYYSRPYYSGYGGYYGGYPGYHGWRW